MRFTFDVEIVAMGLKNWFGIKELKMRIEVICYLKMIFDKK